MAVIEAQGLTRAFRDVNVVDDLDLRVEAGEIFGLLGPNGAGKTTTIRMLTTLLVPTAGTARVCGFDVLREAGRVRRCLGYVMQHPSMSGNYLLTGREKLEIEAALYHVPRSVLQARVEELLELVGLTPHADRLVSEYSGGMQKRLDLACGLVHRPAVLVLDEPSLGLDVQSRHAVWSHIEGRRAEGVTILLATNYLDEADRLCDRLTIIDGGRAVATGAPAELKRTVGGDVVEVVTPSPEDLRRAVAGQGWVRDIVVSPSGEAHVYVDDATVALPALMRMSIERGLQLDRLTYTQPSLDDVFLLHTGRELRELERA